MSSPYSPH